MHACFTNFTAESRRFHRWQIESRYLSELFANGARQLSTVESFVRSILHKQHLNLAAGAGRRPDAEEATPHSQIAPTEMHTSAGMPTLTFPTPSLKPQQRTPTLTGPPVLQPESSMPSASHAASGPRASSTDAPLPESFPTSPMPLAAPSANAPLPKALPSSPVHGVWNRASQAPSTSQERPAAVVSSSRADRDIGTHLADVAAELLPETLQLPGSSSGQQAGHVEQMQEHAFDHRSLLAPAEPQSAALLAVRVTSLLAWHTAEELASPVLTRAVTLEGCFEFLC